MGYYDVMTGSISTFNMLFIIPFVIGIVLGMISATKTLKILFLRYHKLTNCVVSGLVLGSIPLMYVQITNKTNLDGKLHICIIATIIGIIAAFAIRFIGEALENKK